MKGLPLEKESARGPSNKRGSYKTPLQNKDKSKLLPASTDNNVKPKKTLSSKN